MEVRKEVTPQVRVFAERAENVQSSDTEICRLIVEDNGIGFDEQYADRILASLSTAAYGVRGHRHRLGDLQADR